MNTEDIDIVNKMKEIVKSDLEVEASEVETSEVENNAKGTVENNFESNEKEGSEKTWRKEFGAFWLRRSRSGNDFLTGKIEIPKEIIDESQGHPVTVHVIGFKNRKKNLKDESDRSPYLHVYIDDRRETGAVELKAEILPD